MACTQRRAKFFKRTASIGTRKRSALCSARRAHSSSSTNTSTPSGSCPVMQASPGRRRKTFKFVKRYGGDWVSGKLQKSKTELQGRLLRARCGGGQLLP